MNCKNHQDKLAGYHCTQCNHDFCQPCIISRKIDDTFTAYICKECGGKCEPLAKTAPKKKEGRRFFVFLEGKEIKPQPQKAQQEKTVQVKAVSRPALEFVLASFWAGLGESLIFPFKGMGILLVVLFAGLLWGSDQLYLLWPKPALAVAFILLTYLAVYLFKTAENSLHGSTKLEGLPDEKYWVEISTPLLWILAAFIIYAAPAQVYFIYFQKFDFVYFILTGVGFFLLPMAFLKIIVARKLSLLNPVDVVSSALKTLAPYIVLMVVFLLLNILLIYVNGEFFVEYEKAGSALCRFFFVYLAFVGARLLGLFARFHEAIILGAEGKKTV